MISSFAEASGEFEITEVFRHAGSDGQSCVGRIYTQNVLGDINEGPCRSTGQPAVLCLAMEFGVPAGYHLGVYIRFGAVNLADVLHISGTGFLVNFKGTLTASDNGLSDGYPGIVVTEDTGVFLVSWRIGGNFTEFKVISGVGGL